MATKRRRFRVAEKLQALIASNLIRLSDPRIHLVTVTSVVVSPDLRQAKIYWIATGVEGRREEIESGLEAASKHLRSLVSKELGIRYTPELRFYYDDTFDVQQRVDDMMKDISPPSSEPE